MKIREVKKLIGPDLVKSIHSIHRNVSRRSETIGRGPVGSTEVIKRAVIDIDLRGPTWEDDRIEIIDIINESGLAEKVKIDWMGNIVIEGHWETVSAR
jgi:hypothetical protein|tara:strand:- start:86 stop:379 length:294 start_codon:yes stop_codon:yes gene_type:complete